MWILIILAINVNNPDDVPGQVTLKFQNGQQCYEALASLQYKLKFSNFYVSGKCQRSS